MESQVQGWLTRGALLAVSGIVALVVTVIVVSNCVEWLDAKHIMVIQYPDGDMKTFTEQGPKAQWFGTFTKYPRRVTYSFANSAACNQRDNQGYVPFKVQFNDGGTADMCGSLQWEMPLKPAHLVKLQKDYGSTEAIDQQLVQKALNNAIYFAGPTMSSIESTAERKSELLQYIDDQLRHGIYKVITKSEKQKDEITGVEKTVRVVEIVRDKDGNALRSVESALAEYGIQINQLAISEIHYDEAVKGQIKVRQDSINAVQISIADARKAEQAKLTAEANGARDAAVAKWKQEVEKAKFVTEAQQRLEVATLDAKAAEQYKRKLILEGEGEAAKRQLVMNADGALDKKLEALVTINGYYADALQNYAGNWVPVVSMDKAGGTNQGLALVDLLTAKTARDLGLDLSVVGQGKTAAKK